MRIGEQSFRLMSHKANILVVVHTERGDNIRVIRPAGRTDGNDNRMPRTGKEPKMQAHYDFQGGERGKFVRRYARGTNVVVLESDVAKAFPTADAVNRSLRAVRELTRLQSAGKKGAV